MARKKLTQDEMQERFKTQLEKANEALQALETRLSELDKEREKVIAKIRDRRAEAEKYQAFVKERTYSVFEETLRLKGLNLEDVTKAIANGDTKFLLELSNRRAEAQEPEAEASTEKVEADAPAPQNEATGELLETNAPGYPPQQVAALRPDNTGSQGQPIDITQYGKTAAKAASPGWNA